MPTNTLTDAQCRKAKAEDKAYKLFDGGGLHLWVSPAGGKVWRLAFRIAGKPKTMSFGSYPAVSLADARNKRDQAKEQLAAGEDPMAPRRANRAGLKFKEAAAMYWDGRKDLSDSYRANATRAIEMHINPHLGDRNIDSITRTDLLTELEAMDAKGLHVYVRKCRMWVAQVFDWAIEREHATINPAASINTKKAFGKVAVEHFAAVEIKEVPALMERLSLEGQLQSALACKALAYTWSRTTELRMMEWTELDGDLWRIPGAKMKRRRDHVVPLTSQMLAIIETMRQRSRGGPYVFPSDHRIDRPMSENAVLYLLHRIGYKGKMTGHGWRSVGSTWANEKGYNEDAIERLLAHAPEDKVRSAYNRAEYLPERRQILQDWCNWLDSQLSGDV